MDDLSLTEVFASRVWRDAVDALHEAGYDGWLMIEAFGLALPELVAATKIWRRMYDSEEQLARDGWGRTPIVKLRFRCAICDGPAQRQLRPPPMPAAQSRAGWITPPSSYVPGTGIRGTSAVEHRPSSFLSRTIS